MSLSSSHSTAADLAVAHARHMRLFLSPSRLVEQRDHLHAQAWIPDEQRDRRSQAAWSCANDDNIVVLRASMHRGVMRRGCHACQCERFGAPGTHSTAQACLPYCTRKIATTMPVSLQNLVCKSSSSYRVQGLTLGVNRLSRSDEGRHSCRRRGRHAAGQYRHSAPRACARRAGRCAGAAEADACRSLSEAS